MVNKVRALILSGFGINCEEEMAAAYQQSEADAAIVHIKDLFSQKVSLLDFDILNLPGGFSYGDDLGAGRVLAHNLRYKKMANGTPFFQELLAFLEAGKYILGICNGFQTLLSLGLLPGLSTTYEQHASLIANDSGKFEDRWCRCTVPLDVKMPLLTPGATFDLPVRHGEGKLIVAPYVKREMLAQGLIVMQYCDHKGRPTQEYPYNPNGSYMSCAALTNPSRQIVGMMPHPEAFLSIYNHPNWGSMIRHKPNHTQEGEGLVFFRQIISFINKKMITSGKCYATN